MRFAARRGDAWVTTGGNAETVDDWFAGLKASTRVLDEALTAAGREPGGFDRYLNLDSSPRFSLESMLRIFACVLVATVLTWWLAERAFEYFLSG